MALRSLAVLIVTLSLFVSASHGHNITRILAEHPQYSTFNKYLSLTHLAGEINRRLTITVLVVDNAAMSSLLAKGLSIYTLRNVLSLHVLADYYGTKKLHKLSHDSTLVASLFQATGSATGTAGFVNITDLGKGKVGFGVQESKKLTAHFIKSVKETPYNLSVLEISQVLTSEEAEAPTAGPGQFDLISILSKRDCKSFADILVSTGANSTYQTSIEAGLTVFCPTDGAVKSVMPRYKNLTDPQKLSLALYHGFATYNSLQMFKQNNGVYDTLASGAKKKYDVTLQTDGEDITAETTVVTVKIVATVIDQEPLVVYQINKVMLPPELFKPTTSSPSSSTKKGGGGGSDDEEADAPDADAPEGDSEDQTADNDNGARGSGSGGGRFVMVVLSFFAAIFFLV